VVLVIRVATLNCRNTSDRWRRRRPLLLRQLVALAPDVIGLQELRRFPDQAGWIAGRAGYRSDRAYKTGAAGLWEGVATLSRLPVVERASIPLGGQHRVAQRVTVELPDGGVMEVYNAHLVSGDEGERYRQAARLLEWMSGRRPVAQVLVGDFNATPALASVRLLGERLRSAHVVVHGAEPERTVPTPLRRGAAGRGLVLDYVFVNDLVEVHEAGVVFDELDGDLAASDHYGLLATLSRA
jgi:endonuclease/exonuclease/phosphatase family metal-dependent hydrolase